jgi:hypothetical protein
MAAKTGTYTLINSSTLGSAASSVTFSSIPSTYTDLILVAQLAGSTAGQDFKIQFNGDTGTNYSITVLRGYGTGVTSNRTTNGTYIYLDYSGASLNTVQDQYNISIMDYANTTTYKTLLSRYSSAANSAEATVGLWRSTAAINQVVVSMTAGNLVANSTFKLYGIEAAK